MVNTETKKLTAFGFFNTETHQSTIDFLSLVGPNYVVIEQIKNYGMPMSDFVLDTCRVSGGLEALCELGGIPVAQVPRKTIVTALCGLATAKDTNVKSFLLDYFRPHYAEDFGGGSEPMTGSKSKPGPFYKFKGNPDLWAATAVALYGVLHWKDIFNGNHGV